jgi:hypothetical protein
MAKNKNVTIKIGSDVEEAKKGINSISSQLNQLAKNVQKQQKPLKNFLDSFNAVGKAFGIARSAFSAVKGTIDDITNSYNVQAQAEKQLEAAAKNNPYLSEYSVQQLEEFASGLQSISTVGDEELLPMMAQLAAAGRTQNEIQDIMAAALDMSASGAMSLDAAVKQLNATYSGSAGKLGQLSGEVKGLTTEQLKNGEAVKIMKEQYSGIAKSVTDSTGGWKQFKNTLGDLKETLGSSFANLQNSAGKVLNNFFGTIIEKLSAAGKEADEFKKKLHITDTLNDADASVSDLNGVVEQLQSELKEIDDIKAFSKLSGGAKEFKKNAEEALKAAKAQKEEDTLKWTNAHIEAVNRYAEASIKGDKDRMYTSDQTVKQIQANMQKILAEDEAFITKAEDNFKQADKEASRLNKRWVLEFSQSAEGLAAERVKVEQQLTTAIKKRDAAQKEADKNKGKAESLSKDEKALELISKNNAELQKQLAAIERKYSLMQSEGQEIDELAKAQEILSAKESSYLALISEDTSLVTQNNAVAKARLAEIKSAYDEVTEAIKKKAAAEKDKKALEDLNKETEKLTEEAKKFVGQIKDVKLSDRISEQISLLEANKAKIEGNTEAQEAYNQKIRELKDLLVQVQAEEAARSENETAVQSWAKLHEQKFQIASDFAAKYDEIMSGISNLVAQNAKNEASVKQAELDKQLKAGLISEEEYAEKKEQIERESAEKQYKMQMWAWGANLLNIQAQTALAIVKALAEGGPFTGPAMAALIGVLGGVQLATAIASKPQPPAFATGGIVGGNSYTGDNVIARVNSGERILTQAQSKALENSIASLGSGGGGVSMNVKIINNASGEVSATPKMTAQGLQVTIDKMVNSSMKEGNYTDSMNIAQSRAKGAVYL